jgi:ADP-heptose:LPS heptosyltransferase
MEAGVAEAVLRTVTGFSRPLVGLHLGASEANKRWPLSHWTALAADLAAAGLGVAVLGGTGEVADGRDIAARSGPGVALLAGKTTVRDLAYVVANCDVVVGGDTGAVHVAALVGTPTVCMMGATDPTKTGPYGPRHQVIHLGMDCSPCFRRPTCAGRFDCMVDILPEDVRDACLRSLAMRYRSASRVPLG